MPTSPVGVAAAWAASIQQLALIRGLLRPDDTLLDVGAGTGRFALPLASSVKQVTALD
jgi:ubiquinone/menaquinone biosynthesis C-methylase UbiE